MVDTFDDHSTFGLHRFPSKTQLPCINCFSDVSFPWFNFIYPRTFQISAGMVEENLTLIDKLASVQTKFS